MMAVIATSKSLEWRRRKILAKVTGMPRSPDIFRRVLGAVCLAISAGMLIAGETVLNDKLRGVTFIYYWLTCVIFTGFTLMIALVDLRVVRMRSRREQGKLIEEALREIAAENEKRADNSGQKK
jgi:hypothetical protein